MRDELPSSLDLPGSLVRCSATLLWTNRGRLNAHDLAVIVVELHIIPFDPIIEIVVCLEPAANQARGPPWSPESAENEFDGIGNHTTLVLGVSWKRYDTLPRFL